MSAYSHTQKGIIQPICLSLAVLFLVIVIFTRGVPGLMPGMLFGAVLLLVFSFAFGHLRVRDEGDRLKVAFGPLPLFKKAILYNRMTAVEKDRSTFLAGWGIHLTKKGWLWNIGGYDCVWIGMGNKGTLIGTDDADTLVTFLQSRISTVSRAVEKGA